jgi:hypothetical protein
MDVVCTTPSSSACGREGSIGLFAFPEDEGELISLGATPPLRLLAH